jgi:hypothetical protein
MPQPLNIPVPESAYRQPRPVLKNRRARRRSMVRPELTLVTSEACAPELSPIPTEQDAASLSTTSLTNHYLSQAVLLDWLGSQPVAFHRVYVDVCGSVNAAVWLSLVLSLLDGHGKKRVDAQGIFRFGLSTSQCEAQTGLTYAEQRKAQRQLVKSQLLALERKQTSHASPRFALDMNALTRLLLSRSSGLADLIQQNAPGSSVDVATLERRAQARATTRCA